MRVECKTSDPSRFQFPTFGIVSIFQCLKLSEIKEWFKPVPYSLLTDIFFSGSPWWSTGWERCSDFGTRWYHECEAWWYYFSWCTSFGRSPKINQVKAILNAVDFGNFRRILLASLCNAVWQKSNVMFEYLLQYGTHNHLCYHFPSSHWWVGCKGFSFKNLWWSQWALRSGLLHRLWGAQWDPLLPCGRSGFWDSEVCNLIDFTLSANSLLLLPNKKSWGWSVLRLYL